MNDGYPGVPKIRRTRLSREQREAQLLGVGVDWLAHRPLESITMEEIAAEVGVSPGLVFYYFDSRQGLHLAILRAVAAEFVDALAPMMGLPAEGRIRAGVDLAMHYVQGNRRRFNTLASSLVSEDPQLRAIAREARDSVECFVRQTLLSLGVEITPLLSIGITAWIAMTEQTLISQAAPHRDVELDPDQVADYLERSLFAMIEAGSTPQ